MSGEERELPPAKRRAVEDDEGTKGAVATEGGVDLLAPFTTKEEMSSFFATAKELLSKESEGIAVWDELLAKDNHTAFFTSLAAIDLKIATPAVAESLLRLIISAYHNLEIEQIRNFFVPLISFPLFMSLSERRRTLESEVNPKLGKALKSLQKKVAKDETTRAAERGFIPRLVTGFLATVHKADVLLRSGVLGTGNNAQAERAEGYISLCNRFLELFTDLLFQMRPRRYLLAYLEDMHVYTHCKNSLISQYTAESGILFKALTAIMHKGLSFPVNDDGDEMKEEDIEHRYNAFATAFQRAAHGAHRDKLPQLPNFSMLENRKSLEKFLAPLSDTELERFAEKLCVFDKKSFSVDAKESAANRSLILDALVCRHERRPDFSDLTTVPLYPDEDAMFLSGEIPPYEYDGSSPCALPKLGLQFLTIQDYLLRNFKLVQLESTYEIRQDLEYHLPKMRPAVNGLNQVRFAGKSRMLLPIMSSEILKVSAPAIGYTRPADVRGEIHFSLHEAANHSVRQEWSEIKQHDVLMLISFSPEARNAAKGNFLQTFGISAIRGCEVVDIRDDEGNVTTGYDMMGKGVTLTGQTRHVRVTLDPVTYHSDFHSGKVSLYDNFQLVMRRRPEENNFKAVLETIRSLMKFPNAIPEWLTGVLLGHGDPDSAHYTEVEADEMDDEAEEGKEKAVDQVIAKSLKVKTGQYLYEEDKPKPKVIDFSEKQSEVLKIANHKGLSIVVGPPGTGKTDVAVQIITNLYHNNPTQTTLIVTHSNAALNDIFTKVMHQDIDERHLLRLGMGEKDLQTEKDFSRWGRVNYMLERRVTLLERVAKLCKTLDVDDGFAHTCESSGHFFAHHVQTRWTQFLQSLPSEESDQTARWVVNNFPFTAYFDDTLSPFWEPATSYDAALARARLAWDHFEELFDEVKDCRAFELLRTSSDRGTYLLTKQARIIAMTCTHAALKRKDFLRLGLKYDNLVMEESAQILEVETFIPMTLQAPIEERGEEGVSSRLKRIVLIGDHQQLPPVVKNTTFQKYCKMDQSMFTRLVRYGVPYVQLDAQGRMREELADLFRWRYQQLKDLPHVKSAPEYLTANPGLSYTCQCINVEGTESQPQPHFYQNVIEAEYVVHMYKYMKLLGYDSNKITILTTYNGQKHLIKDVLNHRCKGSLYGTHPRVSTVDKYQGQQNDYVLVSLVRSDRVGHFRDVRRLVVALSRARLGLYVFGKVSLFSGVWELKEAFGHLLKNPTALSLNIDEVKFETTRAGAETGPKTKVSDCNALSKFVAKMETVAVAANRQKQAAEAVDPEQELWEKRRNTEYSESAQWTGARAGFFFGDGEFGVGYYLDRWGTTLSDSVRTKVGATAGGVKAATTAPPPVAVANPAAEARRRALEKVRIAQLAAAEDSDED